MITKLIYLKAIKDIQLSTFFMSFPIILALTERFNELFVVSKKQIKTNTNVKNTSLISFTVGLLFAIVGFRILETFMLLPDTTDIMQINFFRFIDVLQAS